MKRTELMQLLTVAALWGSSYLFMRLGAGEFGAFALAGVRALGACLLMLPLLALREGFGDWRRYGKHIAVLGLTNSTLPFVLFSYAALSIGAGLSALLNATTPLFAAAVGWFWLRTRLSLAQWLGLGVGFAGVAALVLHKSGFAAGSGQTGAAIAACLGATFCYGFSANYSKRYLSQAAPLAVATGGNLVSALLLAAPALWLWPQTMPSAKAWLAVAALVVGATSIAYVLYYRLVAAIGAARTVTVAYLIPLFGVFWAWLFLGEAFSAGMALGCAIILLGVALTTGLLRLPQRGATAPAPG